MTSIDVPLRTLADTQSLGAFLGREALEGDVICLDGDLGAGKTTLVQAIAVGLDVSREYYVTSPSFSLLHEYPGRIPLYHMDFYRLSSEDDIVDTGLDEYFHTSGLTVIEWSQKALGILPENSLFIALGKTQDGCRIASCRSTNQTWMDTLQRALKVMTDGK